MAIIKPFHCIRPVPQKAADIAALPYDVYNREEAKAEVQKVPDSFLKIDRAETQFSDDVDTYDARVYQKAHDTLWKMVEDGEFLVEDKKCYYVYELTMNNRTQVGLAACASIDDYADNIIKKHENTRPEKEQDRINHVNLCNAQTGPIFLAYRTNQTIKGVVERAMKEEPLYDFISPDQIRHRVFRIEEQQEIKTIENAFEQIGEIYIADGHHRAASAVKVGFMRREENPAYDPSAEFNYFLSVLFPEDELMIMDYNRVVKDLNGLTADEFLEKMQEIFLVEPQTEERKPDKKGEFTMYLNGQWYLCNIKEDDKSGDPVSGLDVSILQDKLFSPVLNITDPKTDARIDFVGGIRGLKELERRVNTDCMAAFAMYPTSIQELFSVADADMLMPPKSTWFEPKLRSGLFIHKI